MESVRRVCGGYVEGSGGDMQPIENIVGCMEVAERVHGGYAESTQSAQRVHRGCVEGCGGDM